jgi:hypothetical protein
MQAVDGHIYAHIAGGLVAWLFDITQLPEWNEDQFPTVDVTDLDPPAQVGWTATDTGGVWTLLAPPPPPPLNGWQEQQVRIAQGLIATSTGTPAASATYPLDNAAVALLGSYARDVASGLGLPDSTVPPTGTTRGARSAAATVPYADIDGTRHDLTPEQVTALYLAQADVRATLDAQGLVLDGGGTPAWPSMEITIP